MSKDQDLERIECEADVLLLTAVPDELEIILELGDPWIAGKDGRSYPIHRWTDEAGRVWILARATAMGGDAAANVATRLVTQYRPKCLAMVGVCAGWRGKVSLGDVIVADRCFRYDAGKLKVNVENDKRESVLMNDITTFNLTPQWKQYAENIASDWEPSAWQYEKPLGYEFQERWLVEKLIGEEVNGAGSAASHPERSAMCPDWGDVLERLEKKGWITVGSKLALTAKGRRAANEAAIRHPDGFPSQSASSKAHVAPIGSGTAVVEDPDVFPQIARSVRKVLGVEMEGSAVAAVAEIEGVPHCVVAKGVSDHADADKDDRFRPFAIEGAYRFLKELLNTTLEPAPKKTPFIVPQEDSEAFSGRAEELKSLKTSLLGDDGAHVGSIAGLSGTGGIGKSGLAVRFAVLNRDYFPDGVIGLRVDGKRPDELARSFARDIGVEIAIDDERSATEIMQSVFRTKKALLIFDNADDANVRELIPGGSCKVILTTRDRALPGAIGVSAAARVDVPALPLVDALDLLRAEHCDLINQNLEQAERIVELVGGLPLALQVVSALIAHDNWREDVLAFLADELEAERNRLNTLAVEEFDHLDVRASFNLSLGRMHENEVSTFASASVCDPSGFSVSAAAASSGESEEDAAKMLSRLRRLSVLNSIEGTTPPRFVFHPLMLEFAKEIAVDRGVAGPAAERHANFFADLFANTPFEKGVGSAVEAELGEAISAASWAVSNGEFDQSFVISLQQWLDRSGRWEDAIRLLERYAEWPVDRLSDLARLNVLNQLSKFLIRKGDFLAAVDVLSGSGEIADQGTFGGQHIQGVVLNTYGTALQKKGEFAEAEIALRRSQTLLHQSDDVRGQAMVLNSLGGVLQRQGKFEEAVDAFQSSAEIEERIGNDRGQAMVLNSLGGVLQRQGKFDEAVDAFQSSAEIEERIGNDRGQAMVLNSLGGVLQRQGKFDEAVDAYERSYKLLVEQGDDRGQAMVLNSLGGVLQRQGKFDEAVDAFQSSAEIEERIGNDRGQAMVLNSLGGVLQRQGKFEEAVDAFQRSFKISEQLEDQRSLAMVLNSLGGVLQRQGKFEEAVDAFQRSFKISEQLEDQRSLAMVLNSLGGVLQRQGKFEEAVDAFQRSFKISEQLEDQRSLAMVLNSLGGVLQRQGKFEEAVDAFQRSFKISEQLEDQRSLAMVLNSLGGVLQRQGKFEEAVDAFQRSFKISEQLEDQRSLAMVLNSLGGVLQRQGKFEEAVDAFQRSAQIGEAISDLRHLAMALNSLGGVLQRQGKFDEAVDAFQRSFKISEQLEDQRSLAMVLNSLGGVLQRQGKFEEAVDAFQRSFKISEQLEDQRSLAMVLNSLGGVLQRQGKFEEAVDAFQRSAQIGEAISDLRHLAMALNSLGGVLQRQGKFEEAVDAFQRSAQIGEAISDLRHLAMALNSLGGVLQRQGKFEEAVDAYERSYKLLVDQGDDRGQAMVLNSLGGAYQRIGKTDEAEQAFRESIGIGERLRDKSHLAKVHTAFGKALSHRREFARAVDELVKGFELDEERRNRRGMRFVTQPLVEALRHSGRLEEAENFIRRATAVAPRDEKLRRMLEQKARSAVATRKVLGVVKRVLEPMGKPPFAFIVPDDEGADIYVNERGIGAETFSQLSKGQRVEAMVFKNDRGGSVASSVRIL